MGGWGTRWHFTIMLKFPMKTRSNIMDVLGFAKNVTNRGVHFFLKKKLVFFSLGLLDLKKKSVFAKNPRNQYYYDIQLRIFWKS